MPRADADVAVALVRAAGEAVRAARERGGRAVIAEAKTAATDVVTAADHAAEAAMVEILRAERPDDGILGEEGSSAEARSGRRWVLDALDGTLNFATGLGPYCCAAALVEDERALTVAVLDPVGGRLWTAAAGEGAYADGAPIRVAGPERLQDAILATYAHPDRKGRPGVLDGVRDLVAQAGMLRIIGSGTLDLAWVAEGHLHGWVQPGVEPWDWYPGALLVAEAGGVEAEVVRAGTPWRIAAANPALLDELAAAIRG